MAAQGQQQGTGFVAKHDFFAFPAFLIIDVVKLSTPFCLLSFILTRMFSIETTLENVTKRKYLLSSQTDKQAHLDVSNLHVLHRKKST